MDELADLTRLTRGGDDPRTLRITRRSAVKARAQAGDQLQALLVTAPEVLKSELCGLSTARVVEKASRLRPDTTPSDVEAPPSSRYAR